MIIVNTKVHVTVTWRLLQRCNLFISSAQKASPAILWTPCSWLRLRTRCTVYLPVSFLAFIQTIIMPSEPRLFVLYGPTFLLRSLAYYFTRPFTVNDFNLSCFYFMMFLIVYFYSLNFILIFEQCKLKKSSYNESNITNKLQMILSTCSTRPIKCCK